MAWIKTIDESEAEEALKQIYHEQRRQAGAVANILKTHSLAPEVLRAHIVIYKAAMHAEAPVHSIGEAPWILAARNHSYSAAS